MITQNSLDKMYTEGQKANRPNKRFWKKHDKKVRVGTAKAKALENAK